MQNNILIVDDKLSILYAVEICLKKDFNIFTASNGLEAWDIIKVQEIHCMVTDIEMPVMNGIELIEKIREANYNIITIVASGNDDTKLFQWISDLPQKSGHI